eukprot:5322971-Amphidinium_carterae.2
MHKANEKRDAEEQARIRKMNEDANWRHLADGLKLLHMADHDATSALDQFLLMEIFQFSLVVLVVKLLRVYVHTASASNKA